MGGGFAPRFAVEAVFLILLAVGAGFANLRDIVIVAVMGGGWLLVVLIEFFAWRASARTALRVSALPQRSEPAPEWTVEEILVPEAELEGGAEGGAAGAAPEAEPEPDEGGLTSVLPAEAPDGEGEGEERPRKRRRLRRRAEAAE
jgi:hypothetical protein